MNIEGNVSRCDNSHWHIHKYIITIQATEQTEDSNTPSAHSILAGPFTNEFWRSFLRENKIYNNHSRNPE